MTDEVEQYSRHLASIGAEVAKIDKAPYAKFMMFAKKFRAHVVDYIESGSSGEPWAKIERPEALLTSANAISSRIKDDEREKAVMDTFEFSPEHGIIKVANAGESRFEEEHQVVLDIDWPAMLLDSSTEGHHHLIIQKPMGWEDYKKLLKVMGEVGLLEEGYVEASINRHGSYIRTPWSKK